MALRTLIGAGLAAAIALASAPAAAAPVQSLNDADGRALILVPLTLTKIEDLDFGGVIPSSSSGIVTIDAATGARTFGGGATGVPGDAGNRAYFGGAGSPNQQVLASGWPGTRMRALLTTFTGTPRRQATL